ncbi:MAG: hypothetical protein AB2401_04945 [Bacillus sp. (in: firmicutes)]
MLSEEEPSLDRFGGNAQKVVRSRGDFRQVCRQTKKSCQNLIQLQTGLKVKQKKLSKEEPTSDRFVGKAQKVVRRRANFRQVWRKSRKSCQKKSQL